VCQDCGCEQGNARAHITKHHSHDHTESKGFEEIHVHVHSDPSVNIRGSEIHVHVHLTRDGEAHPHDHDHDHEHLSESKALASREIVLESRVLARNDEFAELNRTLLKDRGCVAINFISSPGSGKTLLLEKTLEGLADRVKCAVIAGDQQTDNDAVRLRSKGAPVLQIETGSSCHLNAEQVGEAIRQVLQEDTRLLFIENVGNLVCPAAFDLGENYKVVLLSVPEGEDKPLKYPVIFHDATASVITKCDLLEHLDVDMDKYRDSLGRIHPGGRTFELSALTGDGMEGWLSYLESLVT